MMDTVIATLLLAVVPLLGAILSPLVWSQPDKLKTWSIMVSLISFGTTVGLSSSLVTQPEGPLLLYLLPLVACMSILGQPVHQSHRPAWIVTLVLLGFGLVTLASHTMVGQVSLVALFGLVIGLLYRHHGALWPMSWWGIGIYGLGAVATGLFMVASSPLSSLASLLACAILLPLVPFHDGYFTALTRLPGNLPSFVVVLFPAVGFHGLVSAMTSVPQTAATTIMIFALISTVYGAIKALAQSRMRLLLAYSSLSLFSMLWWFAAATGVTTSPAAVFVGAVSVGTSGLLIAWQVIRTRYGDDIDQQAISGLVSTMPQFAVLLSLVALAVMGLPPFGVFSGFMGLLLTSPVPSMVSLLVILIAWLAASWYILDAVQSLLFGRQRPDLRYEDLSRSEFTALLLVVLIVLALGVVPASQFAPHTATSMAGTGIGSFVWNQ